MGFVEAARTVFRKALVFQGRARRSEYWWWALFSFLVSVPAVVIDMVMAWNTLTTQPSATPFMPFSIVVSLVLLVPSLAVTARRLHDTGKSGWWQVLGYVLSLPNYLQPLFGRSLVSGGMTLIFGLVAFVWAIVMLVWTVTDSHPGENRYGPNPKMTTPQNITPYR